VESILVLSHTDETGSTLTRASLEAVTAGMELAGQLSATLTIGMIGANPAPAASSLPSQGVRLMAVAGEAFAQPRYASDFPPSLTAHDIGLKDLLESAALLGDLPAVDLITISVGEISDLTMELSPAVSAALPQVVELVERCLQRENLTAQSRGSYPRRGNVAARWPGR